MCPSFGTRRTRLPGMQKLYDISDSFFCAMHIGAFHLNLSFEKSHFGIQHQISFVDLQFAILFLKNVQFFSLFAVLFFCEFILM